MNNESSESNQLRRVVDEAIVLAHEAKSQYRASKAEGAVNEAVRRDLRQALINLYNVLKQWHDHPNVTNIWQDKDLNQVESWINTTTTISTAGTGMGGSQNSEEVPIIQQIDPEVLAQTIDILQEVARELGFAPQTNDRAPLEVGTISDVKWLLTVRGQAPALKDLKPPNLDEDDIEKITDGGTVVASTGGGSELPQPTIEDHATRYPFRGPFFQEVNKRKDQGKDAKITVASANAETGVGKSTCAYYLAQVLDNTKDGFQAEEKSTLEVQQFLSLYDELPKGSAAILDEAEQIDSRRAMSQENVDAAEHWQKRRVQEICAILTLPKFSVLDKRMRNLVDYRVEVHARGEATIYKKSMKPFSGDIWWQELQEFSFPNLDGLRGMEHLHQLKDEHISVGGGSGQNYVSEDEVEQRVEERLKEQAQERRDKRIRSLAEDGQSAPEIASDADVDVSARQVRNILKKMGYVHKDGEWVEP